jgi:hypothetical protein
MPVSGVICMLPIWASRSASDEPWATIGLWALGTAILSAIIQAFAERGYSAGFRDGEDWGRRTPNYYQADETPQ